MAPLIAPDYWMNSQLSIARFYGMINIENTLYVIVSPENYLVRNDFRRYIASLGFKPVKKAIQRYGDCSKTHKVLTRLAKIIKARKRAEKAQETKEGTLF